LKFQIKKQDAEKKNQSPENKPYATTENVIALLNGFKYHYSIESSLTTRSTTQRGNNGTDIADLRIDVENIIFNETVHYITNVVLKQDGVNCLAKMETTPELITKAFALTFKAIDKAEIFTIIKEELLKDNRFKKDKKASEYFNNNVKVFVSWLDYKSTFFSVTQNIKNVLNKNRHFC